MDNYKMWYGSTSTNVMAALPNIGFGDCFPLPPNGILPGVKFTLRPSLAFSYKLIGIVTARHLSSGR